MKNFKKLMALVIAAVMVVGSMSLGAFAAPGDLAHNETLTVSGLGKDDTVTYYQILKWDVSEETGDPANGWVWGSFATPDNDKKIAGYLASDIYGANDGQNKITAEMAGKLSAAATTAMTTPAGQNNNGTWTVTDVPAGLYMVIITSNTPGTMYNPVFVAANFIGGNESNIPGSSIILTSDEPSYSDNAVAKKSTIPLNKVATGNEESGAALDDDDPDRVDVGEIVNYTVDTKIPKFTSDYTNPVFQIEDTLVGLTLVGAPVVHKDSATGEVIAASNYDYTATDTDGNPGYTIKFKKAYLDSVAQAGQVIYITYQAEVTDAATKIINQEKNTVTLSFSTNPKDTSGQGKLRDRTNHYTFSIDADLLGDSDNESSTEAIKVGLDKDGNPIEVSQTYWHGGTHPALVGAEFGLYKDIADAQAENDNFYTNDVFTTGKVTSDASGRLTIKGLDVGTYYLKELKAPNGYIKWQDPIEVVITADIDTNVTVKEDADGVPVTYVTNELISYSVKVGGTTTTYSIKHSLSNITESQVKRTSNGDEEIVNKKGVELPSTGGMGTTLFYAIGAILVLGAGILLVSKRRMAAN